MRDMVLKTFERFLRYSTGCGYDEFKDIYPEEEQEEAINYLYMRWVEFEKPHESLKIIANMKIKEHFGFEIK